MRKCKLLILLLIISPIIMGYTVEDKDISVMVDDIEVLSYNVEISWDSMEFTYTETVNYIWDIDNHIYEKGESTYKWNTSNNNIKINNKSKMPIDIELKYLRENSNIDGIFDIEKKTIQSNEEIISKLMLEGELSSKINNYIKIGTINLLIS